MQVRVIGLGTILRVERCVLTGKLATGYIDLGDGNISPCYLPVLGPVNVDELVEVPKHLVKRARAVMV